MSEPSHTTGSLPPQERTLQLYPAPRPGKDNWWPGQRPEGTNDTNALWQPLGELHPPVLQQELQHHGADDGGLVHDVIKRGQRFCVLTVSCGQKEGATAQLHIRGRKRTELWGQEETHSLCGTSLRVSFCMNSKDSRLSITLFSGGALSLKHMVETKSTKKLLHKRRKWACFSTASLGTEERQCHRTLHLSTQSSQRPGQHCRFK